MGQQLQGSGLLFEQPATKAKPSIGAQEETEVQDQEEPAATMEAHQDYHPARVAHYPHHHLSVMDRLLVGVIGVIGAIIGFLLYRRRQNKKHRSQGTSLTAEDVIKAERSSNAVVHSSSSHRNGGSGGCISCIGGENIRTTISYPMPPAYLPSASHSFRHRKTPLFGARRKTWRKDRSF